MQNSQSVNVQAVDNVLNSVWKLFEKNGYQPFRSDMQWELLINGAADIRKKYASDPHIGNYCGAMLLSVQDYYVHKGKEKENGSAAVPDRNGIYNAVQDIHRIIKGEAEADAASQKYASCSPAVQELFGDMVAAAAELKGAGG